MIGSIVGYRAGDAKYVDGIKIFMIIATATGRIIVWCWFFVIQFWVPFIDAMNTMTKEILSPCQYEEINITRSLKIYQLTTKDRRDTRAEKIGMESLAKNHIREGDHKIHPSI